MNNDLTRIAVILDRSGSMEDIRSATVSGFNEYVGKLRSQPGAVHLLLTRFDDQYEVVFDKWLNEIPTLSDQDLVPRGTTALYDAMGKTIVRLGEELSNTPEPDRPGKVIVMVMTDGLENASQEYNRARIADLVKQQRDQYSWEFLFFGANQDAVLVAQAMNIPQGTAMQYSANAAATQNVMKSAAGASNYLRSVARVGATGQSLAFAFTQSERDDAMAQSGDGNQ